MAWTPHTYLTFGGTLADNGLPDEIWQCGIRGLDTAGSPASPIGEDQLLNFVTAVATQVSGTQNLLGWFQAAGSQISNKATLNWVKAANIGADGKYTGAAAQYAYSTPGVGGVSIVGAPSFCSVALSFKTTVGFGRKLRYGRVYPPNFTAAPNGSYITATVQSNLEASAKVLLSAVAQSASQYAFTPIVASSEGGWAAINGVRIGNVYDVQRRRKNAVAETYIAASWP